MEDHQDSYGRQNQGSDLRASGRERKKRIQAALAEHQLDLLVCALPKNVLMISGYWPVVGSGVVLAFQDGATILLIPEDEADLALSGWADSVHTFSPASLQKVGTLMEAIEKPLANLIRGGQWRVGYEAESSSEPASYAAMHLYGGQMASLIGTCFPQSVLIPSDEMLTELRARKTALEIERIRTACEIAGIAFLASAKSGLTNEIDIANHLRNGLSSGAKTHPEIQRADGFAWCMSGANSALAGAAYARCATAESRMPTWCWFTATLMPMAIGLTLPEHGAQASQTRVREIFSMRSSPPARRLWLRFDRAYRRPLWIRRPGKRCRSADSAPRSNIRPGTGSDLAR